MNTFMKKDSEIDQKISSELKENNRQDLLDEFNKECDLVKRKLKLIHDFILQKIS